MPALKPSWEKVAQALALGEPQRVAYIAGGFSFKPASAHRFCTKPEIVERVAEIRKQREDQDARARLIASQEAGVDQSWIMKHQKQVVLLAMRGQPVRDKDGRKRKDPDTKEVIYKPDLSAANQGLITLGRMIGAFIDRTEIGGPGDFSRLAEAELDAKVIEMAKALGIDEEAVTLALTYQPQEAAE